MIRFDLRFAVKGRVHVTEQSADGVIVLTAHNAVAGRNSHFAAPGSRREGQCGGAMLGDGVHGEILSVHILLSGSGGNLRRRRPVQGLPVRGHANGES